MLEKLFYGSRFQRNSSLIVKFIIAYNLPFMASCGVSSHGEGEKLLLVIRAQASCIKENRAARQDPKLCVGWADSGVFGIVLLFHVFFANIEERGLRGMACFRTKQHTISNYNFIIIKQIRASHARREATESEKAKLEIALN
jgi:hypothetical protein